MPQLPGPVRILAIQHQPGAGLGRFGTWLTDAGASLTTVRPDQGDEVPTPTTFERGYDALIVLGGAAGACDDKTNPWFGAVKELLRASAVGKFPSFNICLGGQMLAVATGGGIHRKPAPSYGVFAIEARPEALTDPVFANFAASTGGRVDTVLFHQDQVELPVGAVHLFTNTGSPAQSPVQAFRVGDCAWGTQFHPETRGVDVAKWLRAVNTPDANANAIVSDIVAAEDGIERTHRLLAEAFVRTCRKQAGLIEPCRLII